MVESTPRRVAVRVHRRFGASTVQQTVTLDAGAARVDIETEVDWHERQKLLKLAFPLDVHADRAASETQFGHVHRPTHTNTSWDAARFEICAHRWVHVGEPGYGVAVANDATYGHDVGRVTRDDGGTTTTVRLSLLRAPLFPRPGEPTRASTCCAAPWWPVPASPTRYARATAPTSRCGRSTAQARSRRSSRWTTSGRRRGGQARRGP